jgi:hypothetical protein
VLNLYLELPDTPLRASIQDQRLAQRLFASVITSKPAIHDHLKTGQRDLTPD